MARRDPRRRPAGGEDIQTLRTHGARVATGIGALACLSVVAVVPVARSEATLQNAVVRVGVIGVVVLLAALVRGWPSLVPVAVVLAGGGYAAELAIDNAPIDTSAPALAAALVVAAELAYWSLEEREQVAAEPGAVARRVVYVAALGLGALVVGALLLVLVDVVDLHSLGLDVAGAVAAATVLAVILITSTDTRRQRG